MKRTIVFGLAIILVFSFCNVFSFAFSEEVLDIHYYNDGSYGVTFLKTSDSKGTKTGTKGYKHYDSGNTLVWEASITATFTYNGTTASCTSVSKSTTIYNNSWRCTASSCSKSGATATGNFTFKHYVLGVPVKTINKTLTLTCDPNGNVT